MANAIYPKWKETLIQGGANSDLDMAGNWTVWVHITFADTRISIGEPSTIKIYEEGE